MFAGEGVSIAPTAVFHPDEGPILLDNGVQVMDFACFRGPLYVGPGSRIIERASVKEFVSMDRILRNSAVVEDFVESRLTVLPYDDKAAWQYGYIRAALERMGQTIGVNDLHIAAHARSNGLTLISNNLREFERVPGLLLENWVSDSRQ